MHSNHVILLWSHVPDSHEDPRSWTHGFIEHLVFPVPLDPLEEVSSLAELHHDEQLSRLSDWHRVQDLDNMTVIYLSLDLDLGEENMKKFPLSKYVETVSIKRVLGLSPRRLGCKANFHVPPSFHSLRVGGAIPGPTTTPKIIGHLSVNGLTNPLNRRSKG